jgi:phage N-6-adenine-methyltransferase
MTAITTTIAVDIAREHDLAQQAFEEAVTHAIRCGQLLAEAKDRLPHGQFGRWLDEHFPASRRTAQGYMRMAAHVEDAQRVAHLGIAGALKEISTPKGVERLELQDAQPIFEPRAKDPRYTFYEGRWVRVDKPLSIREQAAELLDVTVQHIDRADRIRREDPILAGKIMLGEISLGDAERGVHRHSVHFSSATDEWATPQAFYDVIEAEFHPTLDVCCLESSAKCERYFTPEDNGLEQEWIGVVWMNPPYGDEIERWVKKAHESALEGATVVCLLPARTDTAWWHDYCSHAEVRFIRGRLRFGEATASAPFPSALVIFGREPVSTLDACWEWRS